MPTEIEDYLSLYERYRKQYTELLAALPAAALNWRPPVTGDGPAAATNSPAAIAAHVSGGQRHWIGEIIGGLPAHRDREAELRLAAGDAAQVITLVNTAADTVRAVLAPLAPPDLERTVAFSGQTVTRRWLIVYILGHAAEHWGELMLVRQLWEAGGGK